MNNISYVLVLSAPVHEYSALLDEGNPALLKQKGGAFIIQNAGAKELKSAITSKDDVSVCNLLSVMMKIIKK